MTTPESILHRRIYERSSGLRTLLGNTLELGPGDDCASLRIGGESVLITVDQLVEGRHYTADTPLEHVAHKCIARSVSDIAAMGGTPIASVATGALRDSFAHADALFDAMHAVANALGSPLIGGDIARVDGPTVLTCTVIGTAHATRGAVTRSGARPGDDLFIVGKVGGSLASGRHLTFAPHVREGRWLCDTLGADLHAMIDVSDGVGRDAGRIAEASGVRIELDAAALPLHGGVAGWREGLSDGEDYVLLFASPRTPGAECPATGQPITRVGRVLDAPLPACVVRTPDGDVLDASELGWDHGG